MAYSRRFQEISDRIAPPSHRHAAPSAPWPWVDIQDDGEHPNTLLCISFSSQDLRQEVDRRQLNTSKPPVPSRCNHQPCDNCWKGYPQSLFPNWTPAQVKKSKINIAIRDHRRCIIHHVDVDDNGCFRDAGKHFTTESTINESWDKIVKSRVSSILTLDPFVLHLPPLWFPMVKMDSKEPIDSALLTEPQLTLPSMTGP
jgi:hypothetical protein